MLSPLFSPLLCTLSSSPPSRASPLLRATLPFVGRPHPSVLNGSPSSLSPLDSRPSILYLFAISATASFAGLPPRPFVILFFVSHTASFVSSAPVEDSLPPRLGDAGPCPSDAAGPTPFSFVILPDTIPSDPAPPPTAQLEHVTLADPAAVPTLACPASRGRKWNRRRRSGSSSENPLPPHFTPGGPNAGLHHGSTSSCVHFCRHPTHGLRFSALSERATRHAYQQHALGHLPGYMVPAHTSHQRGNARIGAACWAPPWCRRALLAVRCSSPLCGSPASGA